MGIDLSVCFSEHPLSTAGAHQAITKHGDTGVVVYLTVGEAANCPFDKPFFALWSDDEDLRLEAICKNLTAACGVICVLYKSEHGGVCGYRVFKPGAPAVSYDAEDYDLEVFLDAFELAFGKRPDLKPGDIVLYPESVFGYALDASTLRVERMTVGSSDVEELPATIIEELPSHELGIEPTFPFDEA